MVRGIDLKVERIKTGSTQRDVARHMGISAARVSVIERSGRVMRGDLPAETVDRYRQALSDIKAEQTAGHPTTWRVELLASVGAVQEQYRTGKWQARADVRRHPEVRKYEVVIAPNTPAATTLGYLDGLAAAGGSCVLLDGSGTIVNRRIG